MAARCAAAGLDVVPPGSPADVMVVHTCAVTRTAERKSLRCVRTLKARYPRALVVVAGCAVELLGDESRARSGADLAADQRAKWILPDLLKAKQPAAASAQGGGSPREPSTALPCASGSFESAPVSDDAVAPLRLRPWTHPGRTRALIKVQEGCDFHCAYCVVPRLRGPPRSRPFELCVDSIRQAVAAGCREVVLTGTNLGLYRDGPRRLVHLLRAAEEIAGLDRVRLSSIELTTVEEEIIALMATSRKLCRYLHLPLQSGDDGVLARMGRRYRVDQVRRFVSHALSVVPDLGLGADILVGHPGETAEAFNRTLRLINDLPFSRLHIFPFSPRPGTRASEMRDLPPAEAVRRRRAALARVARDKSEAFARRWVGQPVAVLIEDVDRSGVGSGWTSEYVAARCQGAGLQRNQIVVFTPTRFDRGALWGTASNDAETRATELVSGRLNTRLGQRLAGQAASPSMSCPFSPMEGEAMPSRRHLSYCHPHN